MARLFNDPRDFAEQMLEGFVGANRGSMKRVDGGVVRATRSAEAAVSVVIGGGSGHYPAFAGLVGRGLAQGAVMGNLFASPSRRQVQSVSHAADQGRGILLVYGNYAGDSLNFDFAQADLRGEGIDCRTVKVTDDIYSAPAENREQRRGIAGDIAVIKIAGAAAARGMNLDQVERLAALANDRTRSMGVAFSGCTLPGESEPLFTVPDGRMAVGLGIHGEPGVDEIPVPSADELASLFVERLLADAPSGSTGRVVPILNGLGSVKYEELFVVYGGIERELAARQMETVSPQVGEFCTSFEMAGASLTLLWLDDELEDLWRDPCSSPAFHIDAPVVTPAITAPASVEAPAYREPNTTVPGTVSSEPSRAAAQSVASSLAAIRDTIDVNVIELGRLDSIAGDGDHGIGMQRGSTAAADAALRATEAGAGYASTLHFASVAWSDAAGGTSGALWAQMLAGMAAVSNDTDEVRLDVIIAGVRAARDRVMSAGGAVVGDKTMVDAIVPFAASLETASVGATTREVWARAAAAADVAAQETSELSPRRGRARTHGDRAIGTPDPGAISFALAARAVAETLERHTED